MSVGSHWSSRPKLMSGVFWKKLSQFEFRAFLLNGEGKQVSAEVVCINRSVGDTILSRLMLSLFRCYSLHKSA